MLATFKDYQTLIKPSKYINVKSHRYIVIDKQYNVALNDIITFSVSGYKISVDLNESYYRLPLIEFFLKPLYKIKFRQ